MTTGDKAVPAQNPRPSRLGDQPATTQPDETRIPSHTHTPASSSTPPSVPERVARKAWRVSLHGGHSGAYCDHAVGSLEEILDAAVAAGCDTYGLSEHAPRGAARFLYSEERSMGWDVAKLERDFAAYAHETSALVARYAGRLHVLRGFEAEVVPPEDWLSRMQAYRERYRFDYVVGSVHYVGERSIDGRPETFRLAMDEAGGREALAVRYYRTVADMVLRLRPEVVGHLDLIRKNGAALGALDTDPIRAAAEEALDAVSRVGAILDLNTAGWRKGLDAPYPAPWLVRRADALGIGFCFGDDSHGPEQVAMDLDRGRDYLLDNGVRSISVLRRRPGAGPGEMLDVERVALR